MSDDAPIFTDRTGRAWRLFDYSLIAGKTIHHPLGDTGSYRLFVPEDGGQRRTYHFQLDDDHAPRQDLLELQLMLSRLYWKDEALPSDVRRGVELNVQEPEPLDLSMPS
jgi:hypothetical protein